MSRKSKTGVRYATQVEELLPHAGSEIGNESRSSLSPGRGLREVVRTISLRSLGIRDSSAIFYLEEGKLNQDPPLVSVLVIKEKHFLLALPAEHEAK